MNAMLKCPKCGFTSITAQKKGYGVVKGGLGAAAIGAVTGPVGAIVRLGAVPYGSERKTYTAGIYAERCYSGLRSRCRRRYRVNYMYRLTAILRLFWTISVRMIKRSLSRRFRYTASIVHAIGVPDQYIMQRGGWNSDRTLKAIYRGTIEKYTQKYTDMTIRYFETMQHQK